MVRYSMIKLTVKVSNSYALNFAANKSCDWQPYLPHTAHAKQVVAFKGKYYIFSSLLISIFLYLFGKYSSIFTFLF